MTSGMSSKDLRKSYIDYFTERSHELVPSAPLIPKDDPTLLFTSAGMVPFKRYYLQDEPRFRRAVSVQRCLRLSDLEEVGRSPWHCTFFEMLGNFSFGDYFKREAIEWGWEFLTEVLGLPGERLWITVHRDDEEAAELWRTVIGIPSVRIVPLGDEDNFWGPAGDSGPCGPCSEIHFDMGLELGCGRPDCNPACDCDRFFEVWNLVFPQFLQRPDTTREPLARPGIDTGMGFERVCSVLQGARTIYETDVLAPIVAAARREIAAAGGTAPGGADLDPGLAIIVDHARAATFAVAENINPSNEAQGYVVRRLVRRAVRRGHAFGVTEPFLYRVAGEVIATTADAHPHLTERREHIALVLKSEEERFRETLASGTQVFEGILGRLDSAGSTVMPGGDAFRLYDTYGFPVDLTSEMAAERGVTVDLDGFAAAMDEQRERGRKASSFAGGGREAWSGEPADAVGESGFVGHEIETEDVAEAERAHDGVYAAPVATSIVRVRPGRSEGEWEVTLSRTPFYAEAGGQVADTGALRGDGLEAVIVNVYVEEGHAVHVARVASGAPEPGAAVQALVDVARRRRVEKNHTATHLLQAALREIVGDHVHQSGSWVGPDRLRFDFTHFAELTDDVLSAVEERVNAWIRAGVPVCPEVTTLDVALERGAMALFGEKYDEDVRAVSIPGVSLELCGGTHVGGTGEIGAFSIVSESGIAAGVRRIEAVTGAVATERAREHATVVRDVSSVLRCATPEVLERTRAVVADHAQLRKDLARERRKSADDTIGALADRARDVAGIKVISLRTEAADVPELRTQADRLRETLGSGAGVLGTEIDGRSTLLAVVTDDLAQAGRIKAGDLVREVASVMGGRGGGKPHLAQGGGGDPAKLDQALEAVYGIVERLASS